MDRTIIVDVNTGERMLYRDAMVVAEEHLEKIYHVLQLLSPPRRLPTATFELIRKSADAWPIHCPWWALGLGLDALKAGGRAQVVKVKMPSPDIHIWDEYRWGAL